MKYRLIVECCHKKYSLEATMYDDDDIDDDSLVNFILGGIEHYKSEDGLEGLPHKIIKSEISIDGEVWFASERFIDIDNK